MSDAVIIAICTSVPPTLMAALAWWKARDIHNELNGRTASNDASKEEGEKEEKDKNT